MQGEVFYYRILRGALWGSGDASLLRLLIDTSTSGTSFAADSQRYVEHNKSNNYLWCQWKKNHYANLVGRRCWAVVVFVCGSFRCSSQQSFILYAPIAKKILLMKLRDLENRFVAFTHNPKLNYAEIYFTLGLGLGWLLYSLVTYRYQ